MRDDDHTDDQEDFEMEEETRPARGARRMRLIPMTTVMLGLLLVIKVNEMYIGSRQLRELYTARDAVAETDKGAEKKEAAAASADAAKAEPAKAEAAPAEAIAAGKDVAAPAADAAKEGAADPAKKEDAAKQGEKKEDAGHGEAKKEEGGHGGGEAKPPEEPKTFGTGKSTIKEIEALKAKNSGDQRFSKSEIDLLENLAKRREELDKREREIELKAKVLEATDKRIADKIEEMKTLEAQLSKVVSQYDEKQNTQIASLVKIYESMKPQQAAAIFNELDLPILLDVIDRMSERKVAPVLALMDPKKARDVTQELAAMRKAAPKKAAPAGK